jgi:hypothetical protein
LKGKARNRGQVISLEGDFSKPGRSRPPRGDTDEIIQEWSQIVEAGKKWLQFWFLISMPFTVRACAF